MNSNQPLKSELEIINRIKLINRLKEGKTRGVIPFGYKSDENGFLILDEVESNVIKEIFDSILKGESVQTVADNLNKEYIQTRTSKNKGKDVKWSPSAIKVIVKNTFYKGERVFEGNIFKVPAIFTNNYFIMVNNKLNEKKPYTKRDPINEFLLKGLITCGVCGKPYFGINRLSKNENHYVCSSTRIKGKSCGNKRIRIVELDNLIWKQLVIKNLILKQDYTDYDRYLKIAEKEVIEIEQKIKEHEFEIESKIIMKEKLIHSIKLNLTTEYLVSEIFTNINKDIEDNILNINVLKDKIDKVQNEINSTDFVFRSKDINFLLNINNFYKRCELEQNINEVLINYNIELKKFNFKINYKYSNNTLEYYDISDDKYKELLSLNDLKDCNAYQ